MTLATWAVGIALFLGSIRAIELWRSSPRVDVVNVVVMSALAEGRARDIERLLKGSGSSPYFGVALAMVNAFAKLETDQPRAARPLLEREMLVALATANRALRRFAWLDSFAIASILFAGITAGMAGQPTFVLAFELVAATLLWLSNLYARRSIATRMYAGGSSLVGDLVRGMDTAGLRPDPSQI